MADMKVSPEVKAYIDRMKGQIAQLKAENEALRLELRAQPPVIVNRDQRVRTVQATAKKWKFLIMVGTLMLLIGLPTFFIGLTNKSGPATMWGMTGMIFGLPTWILGKFGKFWFHE